MATLELDHRSIPHVLLQAIIAQADPSQKICDRTPLRVQVSGGASLDLPPIVSQLLMNILEETAAGHAVTLIPVESEVARQQAAALLNVSRPFVVGMIEKGLLPSRMVGNQRRLPLQDVLAYKADNRAKRRETLRELAKVDQELGLL